MILGRNLIKVVSNIRPSIKKQHNRSLHILGIETSCDDTGVAVVNESGNILGNSLFSQQKIHLKQVASLKPCNPIQQSFPDMEESLHPEPRNCTEKT